MKLVLATPFLETKGGVERVVLKIARHFRAKIHCVRYDPQKTFEDFRKIDIEIARPSILGKLPFGRRVASAIEAGNHFYNLKLDDYDVINAHGTPSEWVRNRNSPVLWYSHSPNREAYDLYEWRMRRRSLLQKPLFWASIQAFKFFERKTVPKIEYIFTNSKNSQGRIKKYLGRESEVLSPGVDVGKFSCRGYENFFLYPSRIAPEKDLEYAIEAFRLFRSRAGGDWRLVIAGSLSSRPEHRAYFKKISAMCDGSVTIETDVSEERLLDLYSRCYAVLYAPVNEDFGLVPLEALSSSKPCIARNEGGPRETIADSKDGFLVDGVDAMARKMELLAAKPELCARMGKSGRKKAEEKFTWERFLARFGEKAGELAKA
ncbi:MAG: glycosyltransferase family 4 protein [Candidatus Micrarchaeota archaeon]